MEILQTPLLWADLHGEPEVLRLLEASCLDCHGKVEEPGVALECLRELRS
jgi:hypothetical protein